MRIFVLFAALILMSGCSFEKMAQKIMPDDLELEFDRLIEATVSKDIDAFLSNADPFFLDPENKKQTIKILDNIKGTVVEEKVFVIAQRYGLTSPSSGKTLTFIGGYEVKTDQEFVLLQYTLQDVGEGPFLTNFNLRLDESSFIEKMSFAGAQKTWKHYLVLVFSAIVPVFIVLTVYFCWRSKGVKRKWLWIIFILLGFHGLVFNWTTGEISNSILRVSQSGVNFSPISFGLLGAGFMKQGLIQPWIISVYFPLGALAFWCFLGRKRPWKAGIAQDKI